LLLRSIIAYLWQRGVEFVEEIEESKIKASNRRATNAIEMKIAVHGCEWFNHAGFVCRGRGFARWLRALC